MSDPSIVPRVERIYKAVAFQTLNVILAFLAVNIVLAAMFFVYDRVKAARSADERVLSYRERFADHDAYKRISRADVDTFLDEQDAFNSIGFQYKPWVQFRHPEFKGRLLNTDKGGFRATRPPANPGDKPRKIYLFGGSTTFGFGVPDDHTIASYVQGYLESKDPSGAVLVKNFGQGFYYSSQEQQLLLSVLKDGDVPEWAVFIDGGNDNAQLALRHDEPHFTPTLERLWSARTGASEDEGSRLPQWIPMARLAESVAAKLGAKTQAVKADDTHQPIRADDNRSDAEKDAIFNYIINRYTANMRITRAVCREYGIKCLFIWQPHPAYKYDRKLHKTYPFPGEVPDHHKRVWAHMEKFEAPDYLFLGAMTEGATEKVYVDDVHYNEVTNEAIAARIGDALAERDAPAQPTQPY